MTSGYVTKGYRWEMGEIISSTNLKSDARYGALGEGGKMG